jgi:dihydrofolate reductase
MAFTLMDGASVLERRVRARRMANPLSDEEVGAFLNDVYARADAFLFGRRTYEIFAGSWGLMKDPSQSPIGQALHSRRKYVASSTLTEPRWADTTVIAGEVAAVSELKAEPGGELQVHGSGAWCAGCSKASWSTRSTC